MHFFAFEPHPGASYWCSFHHLTLEQSAVAGMSEQAAIFFAFGPANASLSGFPFLADGPIDFADYCARMDRPAADQALLWAGYRVLMSIRGFEVAPPAGPEWHADWLSQVPLPWL